MLLCYNFVLKYILFQVRVSLEHRNFGDYKNTIFMQVSRLQYNPSNKSDLSINFAELC